MAHDDSGDSASDSGGPSPGPSTVKTTTASGAKRKRIERACLSCRARRGKCDGAMPCGACSKSGRDCEYPERKKRASMRQIQELEERLRKAESGEFAGTSAGSAARGPSPTIAPTPSGSMPPMMAAPLPGPPWYPGPPPAAYGYHHHPMTMPPMRTPFGQPPLQHSPRLSAPQLPLPVPPRPSSAHGPRYDVPLFLGRGSRPDEQLLAKSGFDLLTEAASNEAASGPSGVGGGLRGPDTPGGDVLDLLELPPRDQALELTTWFFLYVHSIQPILVWPTFMPRVHETFAPATDHRSLDRLWLATINLVLASSAQARLVVSGHDPDGDLPTRYYRRAMRLAPLGTLITTASAGIPTVQYLLLLAQYAMSSSNAQLCSSALALALSTSRRLRLQTPAPAGMDEGERQLRLRVWAACIALEATSGAILGTATSLAPHEYTDEQLPFVPPPRPNEPIHRIHFFVHAVKLFRIMLGILDSLYDRGDAADGHAGSPARVQVVLDFEDKLNEWYEQIPPPLHLRSESKRPHTWMQIQSNLLHGRYLYACLMLHRPLLFHLVGHATSEPGAMAAGPQAGSMRDEMVIVSARRATEAACQLVQFFTSIQPSHLRGAWWHCLSYLYSSAVVILAAQVMVIRRPDLAVVTPYGCDGALDMTIATLEAASTGTESGTVAAAASRTCFERLSRLRRAIRQQQRNEAATSVGSGASVAMDDPVLAQIFSLLPTVTDVADPSASGGGGADTNGATVWQSGVVADDFWSNASTLLANQGLSDLWANADGGPPPF